MRLPVPSTPSSFPDVPAGELEDECRLVGVDQQRLLVETDVGERLHVGQLRVADGVASPGVPRVGTIEHGALRVVSHEGVDVEMSPLSTRRRINARISSRVIAILRVCRHSQFRWLARGLDHCRFSCRFLTQMYARFWVVEGPPCSGRGSGCRSWRS